MAKAEAVLTGNVGVCIATSGPGVAHLVNGLADAQKIPPRCSLLRGSRRVSTPARGTGSD